MLECKLAETVAINTAVGLFFEVNWQSSSDACHPGCPWLDLSRCARPLCGWEEAVSEAHQVTFGYLAGAHEMVMEKVVPGT